MKSVRIWMLKAHRVLGSALSVFLLMWFLSGFVMMYHDYPSWTREEAMTLSEGIVLDKGSQALVDSTHSDLVLVCNSASSYQLTFKHSPAYGMHYELRADGKMARYDLKGAELVPKKPTDTYIKAIAEMWQDEVVRVDTIADLDQWTPFDRLRGDLPFIRLSLAKQGRQVYLSGVDGRILTEHTRAERMWSWLGPIPHWIYFTWLRQDRDLWTWVVIVFSALGTFMLVGGFYIGIDVYRRVRRGKRGLHSPYSKRTYRLHHLFGTLGGAFMLMWCFSGLMSVVEVSPSVNHSSSDRLHKYFSPHSMPRTFYDLPSCGVQPRTTLKEVSWTTVGSIPLVRLAYSDGAGRLTYDYWRTDRVPYVPLELKEEDVREEMRLALPEGCGYELELLDSYDDYYLSTKGELSLPVYRVIPTDSSLPYIYLNPKTGEARVISRSSRLRMWLYNKPHSLRFACLSEYPLLREVVMWLLLALGTVVSLTGLFMSVSYLKRSFRKKKQP